MACFGRPFFISDFRFDIPSPTGSRRCGNTQRGVYLCKGSTSVAKGVEIMTRAVEPGRARGTGKGTRAGEPYGTRFREKGQMTARSTDVYLPSQGMKEVAVCTGCKALYWNKRWYLDENESTKLSSDMVRNEVTCPACQRIQDKNPAGVVTFTGDYLVMHEIEILNTIKNVEEKARTKNPLSRIMEIKQEDNVLTINTTDEKLAEKLGRDIFKAHSGDLEFQWSKDMNFVRVNWNRNA